MILGKDRSFVNRLKAENKLLQLENKKLRDNKNNIEELLKLLGDFNEFGGGLIEIRRINPNSVFLRNPTR